MASVPMSEGKAKLEKAYLSILAPSSPSAGAPPTGGSKIGQFTCMFNPTEYSVQKTANWKRDPQPGAAEATVPQFTGAGPKTMSLSLFIDAADNPSKDVAADVELLFSCCMPTAESRSMNQASPPFVLFGWGSTTSFTAIVKSVNAKYTRFKPDGTVTQAEVQVSLEEVPMAEPSQNPTSGALATRRTHQVLAGETLPTVAYREYRNPNLWRALAEVNGIDDPMRVRPGTTLLVPPAAEAARLS